MSQEPMKNCCICGVRLEGYGNNPEPIVSAENGERCCDQCNGVVVYRRMNDAFQARIDASQEFYTKMKAQ